MSYVHLKSILYTPEAIIKFTNNCNAGKLNKDTYIGEPKQAVLEKIKLRREASIAAVKAGVAGIMEGFRRSDGLQPSGGANTTGKRTIEELEGECVEWERRVKASEAIECNTQATVADLEQRVGATEDIITELQRRVQAAESKERESQVTHTQSGDSNGADLGHEICSCRPSSKSSGRLWHHQMPRSASIRYCSCQMKIAVPLTCGANFVHAGYH